MANPRTQKNTRPRTSLTKSKNNINVVVMPQYEVSNLDQETMKPNLLHYSNDILSPEDLQLQNETIKMINRSLGHDQLSHILNLNLVNKSENDRTELKQIPITKLNTYMVSDNEIDHNTSQLTA